MRVALVGAVGLDDEALQVAFCRAFGGDGDAVFPTAGDGFGHKIVVVAAQTRVFDAADGGAFGQGDGERLRFGCCSFDPHEGAGGEDDGGRYRELHGQARGEPVACGDVDLLIHVCIEGGGVHLGNEFGAAGFELGAVAEGFCFADACAVRFKHHGGARLPAAQLHGLRLGAEAGEGGQGAQQKQREDKKCGLHGVSGVGVCLFLIRRFGAQKAGKEEQGGCRAHAAVRHIEGGPVVAHRPHFRVYPREGEVQKVHDIAVDQILPEAQLLCPGNEEALRETVRHIAEHPRKDEHPGRLHEPRGKKALAIQRGEPHQRRHLHTEEHEGRPHRAVARAEGHARVVHAHQRKIHPLAALPHGDALGRPAQLPVEGEIEHNRPLARLVQSHQRHNQQNKKKSHTVFHGAPIVPHPRSKSEPKHRLHVAEKPLSIRAVLLEHAPHGSIAVKANIRHALKSLRRPPPPPQRPRLPQRIVRFPHPRTHRR